MNAPSRIRAALEAQWSRPEAASVVLRLPRPPSVNELWTRRRDGSVHCTQRYASWKVVAGTAINAQKPGRVSGPYCLYMTVTRSYRGDLGNLEKGASDLLQTHGVIENDRMAEVIHLEWSDQVDGVELTVFPWRPRAC